MRSNQGTLERVIRILLGLAAIGAGFLIHGHGALVITVMVVGFVLAATGLAAYCPVWHLMGISTKRPKR